MLDDLLGKFDIGDLDLGKVKDMVETLWDDKDKIGEVVDFVWSNRDVLNDVMAFHQGSRRRPG